MRNTNNDAKMAQIIAAINYQVWAENDVKQADEAIEVAMEILNCAYAQKTKALGKLAVAEKNLAQVKSLA